MKEKFDRNKSPVNIGEIGVTAGSKDMFYSALKLAKQGIEEHNQELLKNLIDTYGEDEGKQIFEEMKKNRERYNNAIDNIDVSPKPKSRR